MGKAFSKAPLSRWWASVGLLARERGTAVPGAWREEEQEQMKRLRLFSSSAASRPPASGCFRGLFPLPELGVCLCRVCSSSNAAALRPSHQTLRPVRVVARPVRAVARLASPRGPLPQGPLHQKPRRPVARPGTSVGDLHTVKN